jgi:DNA invertase Pin-like site-specific DNA recombinase
VGLTVGYVRVSTEDQIEYSPEAQANRCRQFAKEHDLGAVTILRDEGWSGKNLERPAMRELVALVEADRVTDIVTWRLDRLSRDTGDLNFLVRLCERHCVTLHPINEGAIDLRTASGRMQVGVHGVFAQFYREHIVENVRLGMEHAAQQGRWLNRAPTGYDMIDAKLVANDDAAVVRRIFTLRAAGLSYNDIQAQTGVVYSTARHIVENRVYLGEVRLRERWFPGIHDPIVTADEWTAARRPHIRGRRRGRDVLSGRVRCGLCRRVVGVDYNERGQAIYKCRHRRWTIGHGRALARAQRGWRGRRVRSGDGRVGVAAHRVDDAARGSRHLWNDLFGRVAPTRRSRAGQDGRNEPQADPRSARTMSIMPARNRRSPPRTSFRHRQGGSFLGDSSSSVSFCAACL